MATRFLTLTLNPAVDCTWRVRAPLRPGRVHEVLDEVRTPGGKGVNVAKAIAASGLPVRAGGFIGASEAAFYEEALRPLGIETRFLPVPHPTRCNVMVTDGQGRELKLNRPGFPGMEHDWSALSRYAQDVAAGVDVAVLSGSLPSRFPPDTYERLVRLFHGMGIPVLLDCDGPALRKALAVRPDVIKPNRHELDGLLRRPPRTQRMRLAEVAGLAERIEVVIFSDGARGAWFASRGAMLRARPPRVRVVDTTGAGDWLLGQFCAGYFPRRRLDAPIAARAVAAGTAAVQAQGTPFIPQKSIDRLRALVDVRVYQKTYTGPARRDVSRVTVCSM